MHRVLAIEPDARQADMLRQMFRERIKAHVDVVACREAAVAAIGRKLPDLILVSALLPPRDEEDLVAHLRSLDDAGYLQTLTIPQLREGGVSGRASGLFGRWRRASVADGCAPSVFAAQVAAYLGRADEIRNAHGVGLSALNGALGALEEQSLLDAEVCSAQVTDPDVTESIESYGHQAAATDEPLASAERYVHQEAASDESLTRAEPSVFEAGAGDECVASAERDHARIGDSVGSSAHFEHEPSAGSVSAAPHDPDLSPAEERQIRRQLTDELERVRVETAERRLSELARFQVEADAVRNTAIAQARAAAEAEARHALAGELTRMRAEAEQALADVLTCVRSEAEQTVATEVYRAKEDAEQARLHELARVQAEAERRLQAELGRVRLEAEQLRRSERSEASLAAKRLRESAVREARAAAEDAASSALKAEIERVRAEADMRLSAELERARAEDERQRAVELAAIQAQVAELRKATAEQARSEVAQARAAAHPASAPVNASARPSSVVEAPVVQLAPASLATGPSSGETKWTVPPALAASRRAALRSAVPEQGRRPSDSRTKDEPAVPASSNYYSLWRDGNSQRSETGVRRRDVQSPAFPRRTRWALPIAASLLFMSNGGVSIDTAFWPTTPASSLTALSGAASAPLPLPVVQSRKTRPAERRIAAVPAAADIPGWVAVFSRIPLQVYVDGRLIGTTDDGQLMMAAGRYQVTLVSEQFNYRHTSTFRVRSGEVTPYNVSLPTGIVHVNGFPGTEVWIEGQRRGEAPLRDVAVPIGTREIVARHPDLGERRQTFEVRAGEAIEVTLDLMP